MTSVIHVESNVSGGEVGWGAPLARRRRSGMGLESGHCRRVSAEVFVKSLFSLWLRGEEESVGGRSRRLRENQWSCWRPSSRSARRSHSHCSHGFLLLSIPQLDPFFPFYFHSLSNSVPQFLSSWARVSLFPTFSSFSSLDGNTLRATRLICIGHSLVWIQKSWLNLNIQLMRELNIMNNNYRASYCNNTHLTRRIYLYCTQPQLPTAIIHCFRHLIGNTKAAHVPANGHSASSLQRSHQDTFKVFPHRGTGGTGPFNLHLSPS